MIIRLVKLLFFIGLFLTWQSVGRLNAQIIGPNSISFQGALTGTNGQPLANGPYNLTFRFYTNASTLFALATSSVPNVSVTGGISSTPIPVEISWFNGQTRYLGITVSGVNSGQELSPRLLVTAVPYALNASSLGYGSVNIGSNGYVGLGTTSPSERLEIFDGNLVLRRNEEYPVGERSLRFSTRSTTGGSVQDWAFAAEPVAGRYNGDQNVCDLWLGNRIDSGAWRKWIQIGKAGDMGLVRMEESEATDQMLYWKTRSTTGGSAQYWAMSASIVPGRYNVDQNICDFWIGNKVDSGDWVKHLYISKNGNVGLGTQNPATRLDVDGTVRMTVCQITSDRNAKGRFSSISPRDVLARVASLSIATWSYTNAPEIRHIGPVAQDFHAAFAVGEDDKHIATVDADGVALASIQGLHELLREKDSEIKALKAELNSIRKEVRSDLAALESRLSRNLDIASNPAKQSRPQTEPSLKSDPD